MRRKEQSQALRRRQALAFRPLLLCVIALSCHWSWEHIILYTPLFQSASTNTAFWFSNNFISLTFYGVLLLASDCFERACQRFGMQQIAIACLVPELAGALCYIIAALPASFPHFAWLSDSMSCIHFVASFCVAAGKSVIIVLLLRTLACFTSSEQEIIVGVATVAGLVVYVFAASLIGVLQYAFVLVLPVILALAFVRIPTDGDARTPPLRGRGRRIGGMPLKTLAALFALPMAINFFRGIGSNASPTEDGGGFTAVYAIISLLVGLTLVAAYLIRRKTGGSSKPFFVTGFAAASFLVVLANNHVGIVSHVLVFSAFFAYVTVLYQSICRSVNPLGRGWCRSITVALVFNCGGLTVGSLLSGPLGPSGGSSLFAVAGCALVGLMVAASVYLGHVDRRTAVDSGEAEATPAAPVQDERTASPLPPAAPSAVTLLSIVQRNCLILAQAYGLTRREEDVLGLLARGKSLQGVADELSISANTAKSHIAHVYRKLEVHDREELFGLLEQADEERLKD